MEVLFCPVLPVSRKTLPLLEHAQVLPPCPCTKNRRKMQMSMKEWWKHTDKRKSNYSTEKPVPVSLCPLQNSHGLAKRLNPRPHSETPVTDCLSHSKKAKVKFSRYGPSRPFGT
jgi:hypothetical protein